MSLVEFLLSSYLVTGVVSLSLAVLIFRLARREIHRRPDAWWSSEDAVSIAYAPAVTILGAMAGLLAIVVVSGPVPALHELGIAGGLALVTALLWYLLSTERTAVAADRALTGAAPSGAAAMAAG